MSRIFSNVEERVTTERAYWSDVPKKWVHSDFDADASRHVDIASDIIKRAPGKWRAPTDYSRTIEKGSVFPPLSLSGWQQRRLSNHKLYREYRLIGLNPSLALDAALPAYNLAYKSKAITKALAQLKDQKVNLSVAFGERKRTAEMVTNSVTKIRKAVRSARRLDFPEAARHLAGVRERNPVTNFPKKPRKRPKSKLRSANDKEVSSGWLELQYGWKPLLSDVHGACEELRRNDERFNDRYTCSVKGSSSSGRIQTDSAPVERNLFSAVWWRDFKRTMFRESAYVRLDYVLANPALASLAQAGITNPLEVAWELVPFSFVADWFFPVGAYLGSLDADFGWSFKGGSVTRVMKRTVTGWSSFSRTAITPGMYGVDGSFSAPKASHYRAKMDRAVYASSPIPDLPRLEKDPVRGLRVGNAIALLAQAFR